MKKGQWGKISASSCIWLGLALSIPASAQFSNEWVNFTQSYYKIPVAKDGIYKLSHASLQAAGIPVGAIDPRRINLYHRGSEQAIFVEGQDDASFDPTDYIEFYGRRNDGTLDADLYQPGLQPHPYYNLFNDTSAYFLTWNPLPVLGKRMTSFFEANGGLPAEPYHNAQRLELYTSTYSGGYTINGEIQATAFDQGEGWTGPLICTGLGGCTTQRDFLFENLLGAVPAGNPQLEIVLVGRGSVNHLAEIYAGATAGSLHLLTTAAFNEFNALRLDLPLVSGDIGVDGRMTVRVKVMATGSVDLFSVSSLKVTFPQNFNIGSASEKTLFLIPNATNKSYVELLNPPAGARIWDTSDPDNIGTIGSAPIAGGIAAVVPNTASSRTLYVTNTTLSATLQKVSFRPITPSLHDFVIISHKSLMKPALGYGDAVKAYGGYRASSAGGAYDTLSVSIDQLYNQFNYGETSPRAIYQFMKFLLAGGDPKFLFIIGKGLEVSLGYYRKTSFLPTDLHDLVPSAGMPAADMAFTAGLNGTTHEPAIPTGRLSASTATEVAAYLNKVIESENLPADELWRKDILHLSGGINPGEPQLFRQYMDGFKAVAESFFLGANVETISKQTLNVELINVKDQVNKGLNLITFFGHSGPGTIDIDIGYVSDPTMGYNNVGKYPGFLINGCNAGRFFDNRVTFGEDWILTANKGAKTFIAHSSFGLAGALKQYSDIFYAVAYGDSAFLGKGIGDVQKETARRYLAQSGASILSVTQVQQMFLLGDPAIKLFDPRKPDYEVSDGSLSVASLDGKPVTAQSNSFAIDIGVRNFGRALPGLLHVRVERTLSDNTKVVYDSLFDPVLYQETLRFIIRKGRTSTEFGDTNFKVTIDPVNDFSELDESNNVASLDYFIPLNGTRNLFPPPYSITNTAGLQLVFQNTDLLASNRSFKVEMDTASTFDSPYLKRMTVSAAVLAKVNVILLAEDSLVYYWRTKLDAPLPGESEDWATSSFAFISTSPAGWGQLQFPQLSEDPVTGLVKDPEIKLLKFLETTSMVDVKTFGSANPTPFTQVSLKINEEEFNVSSQGQPCRNNTLNLIAFDKSSTAPYAGIPFSLFDPRSCGREPQMINNFTVSEMETGGQDLSKWVQNVKASDSVVVFSIGDAGYASWSMGVKLQMAQLGVAVTQLDGVQPGEPFVIFGRKGSTPGSALIFRPSQAPLNAQEVSVNKTITGRFTEGSLTSTIVGPAQQWSDLSARIIGASASDIYGVDVTGVDLAGNETLLKNDLTGVNDISDINALLYPYLKLTLQTRDEIDLTPVQLKNWIVHFTPVAEGILVYSGIKEPEQVQEGQAWQSEYAFTNISSVGFQDSLLVRADFYTAEKGSTLRNEFRIKAPVPGDTSRFSIKLDTKGRGGPNDVTVFVNPHLQPEQYYDNNVLALYSHLNVEADRTAPLLQVTIDGRQVTNGDLVARSPKIKLTLIDKNQFLFKKDTLGVNLFLRYPCATEDCPFMRISFSQPDVTWTPATALADFTMTFLPEDLQPGEYALRAEAMDASGNLSGSEPYEVTFIVSDETGFQLLSVYPNPSPDQFYFRIFIGGPAPPEDFHLEVFSVSGTGVRSFGNEVLELFHVGTNEIAIEADDPQGNPLPAGVYFFRMTVTVGGTQFSKSGKLFVIGK